MKNLLPIILSFSLMLGFVPAAFAQLPDPREDEVYEKEWAVGLNMNSGGGLIGGVSVRHARKYFFTKTYTQSLGVNSGKSKSATVKQGYLEKPNHYHSFSLEIINIKHPKEQRTQSLQTGNSFVVGKRNYLMAIKPQYGREIIIFRKARQKGVQISLVTGLGPSIGLVIPYLIRYRYNSGVRTEQYDAEVHENLAKIEGTGSFLQALGKTNVTLGVSAKASLAMEFGVAKRSISGVEAGVMMDTYFREIEIIQVADNTSFYPAMFLTFFFGSRK